MAEGNQVPILFNFQQHGLDIIDRASNKVLALLNALRGAKAVAEVELVPKTDRVRPAIQGIKKDAQETSEAIIQLRISQGKLLQATLPQSNQFFIIRREIIRALEGKESPAGLIEESYRKEFVLLTELTRRFRALKAIRESVQSSSHLEAASNQTGYFFSTPSDTEELVQNYNKMVEKRNPNRLLRGTTLEDIDFEVNAQLFGMYEKLRVRQERLAVRAGLALGLLRGKTNPTKAEIDAFLVKTREHLEEPPPKEAGKFIVTRRGEASQAAISAAELGLLKGVATGALSAQELVKGISVPLSTIYKDIEKKVPKFLEGPPRRRGPGVGQLGVGPIDEFIYGMDYEETGVYGAPDLHGRMMLQMRDRQDRTIAMHQLLQSWQKLQNVAQLSRIMESAGLTLPATGQRAELIALARKLTEPLPGEGLGPGLGLSGQGVGQIRFGPKNVRVQPGMQLVPYYPPGAQTPPLELPGRPGGFGKYTWFRGTVAGGPGWVYGDRSSQALVRVPDVPTGLVPPPPPLPPPSTGTAIVKYVPPGGLVPPERFVGEEIPPGGTGFTGGGGYQGSYYQSQLPPGWRMGGPGYRGYRGGWSTGGPGWGTRGGGAGAPPPPNVPQLPWWLGGPGGGGAGGAGGAGGGGGIGGPFGKFLGRFSSLAYYLGAGAILYPIVGAIYKTIENAKQLEAIITRIHAIYGDSTLGDQMQIQQRVVNVALQYSTNVLETAKAAQLLAQEGLKPQEFTSSLQAISRASIGLGINQEGLTNFIIAIRNATAGENQISPEQATNLLAAFTRRGAVSPQNLMSSVQSLLPSLENFQSSNEDVLNNAALIMSLTSQVARRTNYTGTQVSNALRYFIGRFGNPATISRLELLTGKEFGTAESGGQQLRSFKNIVTDIANAYTDLVKGGQATRAQAILAEGFGVRQVGVGQNVLESWGKILQDMNTALQDNSSATELAAKNQETLNAAMERFSTRFTSWGTVFTRAGEDILGFIERLIEMTEGKNRKGEPDKTSFFARLAQIGEQPIQVPRWLSNLANNAPTGLSDVIPPLESMKPDFLQQIPFAPQTEADRRTELLVSAYEEQRKRLALQGRVLRPLIGPLRPLPAPPPFSILGQATQNLIFGKIAPPPIETIPPPPETTDLTAPAFEPSDFIKFWDRSVRVLKRQTGQDLAIDLLGLQRQDPSRKLRQLTSILEEFFATIHYEERGINQKTGLPYTFDEWADKIDPSLYGKVKQRYHELGRLILQAREDEVFKQMQIQDSKHQTRLNAEDRRYTFAISRIRTRVQTAFGRKGLEPTIPEELAANLEEIQAGRTESLAAQKAAYAAERREIRRTLDLSDDARRLRRRDAAQQNIEQIAIINHKYTELELEAQLNAMYKDRLQYITEIENLAQDLNRGIKDALLRLPSLSRARGGPAVFAGSILQSFAGSLYGKAISRVDLFGREGLFPKVGQYVGALLAKPEEFTDIELPGAAGPEGGQGYGTVLPPSIIRVPKDLDVIRREQKQAQLRAAAAAIGSLAGSYLGRGGVGAQVGAELGSIGGLAGGKELGKLLGAGAGNQVFPIVGGIVGGLLGGLIGGIFDKPKKKPPELVALEKIAANTGEQTALLENTNRLLELQNIAFNVPTGFVLPRYGPINALAGGGTNINVEVNIGSTNASPQQIGSVIAQAISEHLSDEYVSSGRYVARNGY